MKADKKETVRLDGVLVTDLRLAWSPGAQGRLEVNLLERNPLILHFSDPQYIQNTLEALDEARESETRLNLEVDLAEDGTVLEIRILRPEVLYDLADATK